MQHFENIESHMMRSEVEATKRKKKLLNGGKKLKILNIKGDIDKLAQNRRKGKYIEKS